MSDIKDLQKKALEINRRYAEQSKSKGEAPWTVEKLARGYAEDVRELIELLEGKGAPQNKLSHELGDCLWSVLVISYKLGIDIEQSFWRTMTELDDRLNKEKA